MDTVTWFQRWYLDQCNDDWEHTYGVEIGTLDNPGWRVAIDLAGTDLERRPFAAVKDNRTEHDWIDCSVDGGVFKAFGGPLSLTEMLDVFRRWVEGD
jgi:hypothetical protein